MTSTRGKGIFAVLAICAALLVPTAASAGNSYSTSAATSALERAPFSVGFTSLTRNGHIVAVKKFKFSGFKVKCGDSQGSIGGRAPRMKVVDRKFHSVIQKDSGRVFVRGQFRNHGQKVNGTLRFAGKVGDVKCFGKRAFRASQK